MRRAGLRTLVNYFTSAAVLVAVAAVLGGASAARGSAIGVVLVAAVFVAGMAVTYAAAAVVPRASMLVALLTYTLQLLVLLVVLRALERSDWVSSPADRRWTGGAVIVATLLWTAALVRNAVRQLHESAPQETDEDHYHTRVPPHQSSRTGSEEEH